MKRDEEKILLLMVLNRLLECPALNMEDLENETREAITDAWGVVNSIERGVKYDVSVSIGTEEHG